MAWQQDNFTEGYRAPAAMTPAKLAEATSAGFAIIADVLENMLPAGDPRLVTLRSLFSGPPPPLTHCPRCSMPRAEMIWHPTDNLNLCPRCTAPLRP